MRAFTLFSLLSVASSLTLAQTAPAVKAAEQAPATSQRIERIVIEDAGSRVDELRVGGQTQHIRVQPHNSALPAYEVRSPDGTRARPGQLGEGDSVKAPRVWNLGSF